MSIWIDITHLHDEIKKTYGKKGEDKIILSCSSDKEIIRIMEELKQQGKINSGKYQIEALSDTLELQSDAILTSEAIIGLFNKIRLFIVFRSGDVIFFIPDKIQLIYDLARDIYIAGARFEVVY